MSYRNSKRSFWVTIPGILSGIAAVITAIGGLIVILGRPAPPTATPVPPTLTPTITPTATAVPPTLTPTVAPTATPVPPTPTVTPTATPLPLLYSDDFSDPSSGWDVDSDEDSGKGYSDGEYYVLVKKPNLVSWGNPGRAFTDLRLEVDARKVAGSDDNDFGMIVRYRDSDNFYMFVISSDGYYKVRKQVNDEWETLVDWKTSPHINQGESANHLTLVAQGPDFGFYVDGRHLVDVKDSSFAEGDIGLVTSAFDEAGVRVHFDNLEVWALP